MKCFTDLSVNYCNVLKPKNCDGCNFFKTTEQVEKEREKTMQRINSLDETNKKNIYENYFK